MITFTRTTRTEDPLTGVVTTVITTITGSAIQVHGVPQRYRDMGLVLATMPTLLFTPTTYGERPMPGDTCVWPLGGETFTVKDVDPIAPDGVMIMGRVIIG